MNKPKSQVLEELRIAAVDEAKAVAFIEKQRWGNDACCPRCGDMDVYQMMTDGQRNKDYRWRCRGCKAMYTVRTGTVFEGSRIQLRHWCFGFWRASTSKKGVSARRKVGRYKLRRNRSDLLIRKYVVVRKSVGTQS